MNLRVLQALALSWVPLLAVLVAAAAVIDADGGWPVAGPLIVAGAGLSTLGAIAWLRQRPVAPGDDAVYRSTVLVRLALMEAAGLVGFSLAIAVGPWWVSLVGAFFSLAGLGLSWPSDADRERHNLLYLV